MNPQQAENLRILIRHMEGGNVKELYMPLSDHTCGTACCAMGEARRIGISGATILPGDIGAISPSARRAFGMNESNGHPQSWIRLFGGNLRGNYRPTPQEWAVEARKVLAEHGYSMDTDAEWASAKVRQIVQESPAFTEREQPAKLNVQ
jgi:hypothetical protein